MTDLSLRTNQRRALIGDLEAEIRVYADLLRTGAKVSGPKNVRDDGDILPDGCEHHNFPRAEIDALSMLNLRAYCGDEAARSVVSNGRVIERDQCGCGDAMTVPTWPFWKECPFCGWQTDRNDPDQATLPKWLKGILRLTRFVPDVVVSGKCNECGGKGQVVYSYQTGNSWDCRVCKGVGTYTVSIPAPRYLAVCIGLTVGWAVLPAFNLGDPVSCSCHDPDSCRRCVGKAWHGIGATAFFHVLEVCERWTWCPCPDNADVWNDESAANTPDLHPLEWSTPEDVLRQIQNVAELLDPETVREVVRLKMMELTKQ